MTLSMLMTMMTMMTECLMHVFLTFDTSETYVSLSCECVNMLAVHVGFYSILGICTLYTVHVHCILCINTMHELIF